MNHTLPRHTHVSILRGGDSSEYPLSLETGGAVLRTLENAVHTQDIFVDKAGKWHVGGVEREPSRVLGATSVVFNGLHGGLGENGGIQKLLEMHRVPYTGSRALSSALSLNKVKSRELFNGNGLRVPAGVYVTIENPETLTRDLFREIRLPFIIKIPNGGSSHDTHIGLSYEDILETFKELEGKSVLIEEYISGVPVSCGVIENVRNEKLYTLFPVEMNIGKDPIYYHDRRGEYEMRCPSNLSRSVKREIQEVAKKAHETLQLNHYSESDFVVSPSGKVYLLETNALPSLTKNSSFVRGLESNAFDLEKFVHHVLGLALRHK